MTEPAEGEAPQDQPVTEPAEGEAPRDQPAPASPGVATQALLGLYANGWCAAFSVAFLMLGGLVFQEGGGGLIVGAGAACLSATYFSVAVAPFLGRWRDAVGTARYWRLSLALSTGLVLWTALSWSLLVLVVPYAVGVGGGTSPLEAVLLSLDRVMDGLGAFILGLSWLAGLGACGLGRLALSSDPFTYRGNSLWRRVLGAFLLLPYLMALIGAGVTAWQGRRLDPGIMAAYQTEIAAVLAQKGSEAEASGLPTDFIQSGAVRPWLFPGKQRGKLDRKALLETWCREAERLWSGPDFWTKPGLVALARLARDRHIAGVDPEKQGVPEALLAEVTIRCEVVLLEWGGVDVSATQRLYDTRLPAASWAKLVELGLSRTDLASSAALNDTDVRDRFVQAAARVLSKSDYDMDGQLQRRFFQRCLERRDLNALWESFESGKPYPASGAPLDVEPFRKRYAASLDFDLLAIDADIKQATFQEDLARQTLAYHIVMMELKRLEAEGSPLPQTLDQLRPPVVAIAKAYSPWMVLLRLGDGDVALKRVDPHRNGMSLTHRFRAGSPK